MVGIFLYVWKSSKGNFAKVSVGFLIAFIVIFFYAKSRSYHEVTEEEAKMKTREIFDNKIGNELPNGTIVKVGPYCIPAGSNWHVQFTLKYPDKLVKEGIVKIGIRGGNNNGIIEMPTGFTGREDIKEQKPEPVIVEEYVEKE